MFRAKATLTNCKNGYCVAVIAKEGETLKEAIDKLCKELKEKFRE